MADGVAHDRSLDYDFPSHGNSACRERSLALLRSSPGLCLHFLLSGRILRLALGKIRWAYVPAIRLDSLLQYVLLVGMFRPEEICTVSWFGGGVVGIAEYSEDDRPKRSLRGAEHELGAVCLCGGLSDLAGVEEE